MPVGVATVFGARYLLRFCFIYFIIAVFAIVLAPMNMPFVRPAISQGGFVPSAYLLTALPAAASALILRDVAFPVTRLAKQSRLIAERIALIAFSSVLNVAVSLALYARLDGYAHLRVLAIYCILFTGTVLLGSAIAGAVAGGTCALALMLILFAITPLANLNNDLYDPDSLALVVIAIAVFVAGSVVGLALGLDHRTIRQGNMPGVNDL